MQNWTLAACAAVLLVSACGGGGGDGNGSGGQDNTASSSGYPAEPINCEVPTQKQWLRDYMDDRYYWYDKQGTPNLNATSPGAFLNSLLYKPVDRYSFVSRTDEYLSRTQEGEELGWGETLAWADDTFTRLLIAYVEPASPLGLAGAQRGDEVMSIDGLTPDKLRTTRLPAPNSEAFGRTFVLRSQAGKQRSLSLAAKTYKIAPVLSSKVISLSTSMGTRSVGYLAYTQFIAPGNAALGAAFNDFAARGVNELVLDLRYNPGGSVGVARDLASMIGGAALNGEVFTDLRFNAKNTTLNGKFSFRSASLPGSVLSGLQRLVVITSEDTASASELVINGLRPHITNVVLIGETTYGKPYASQPRGACGFTYSVIVSELFNSLGQGGYSQGIPATCNVADDLNHQLGDIQEGRLSAALSYIQNGACPANAPAAAQATKAGTGVGKTRLYDRRTPQSATIDP